MEIVIWMKTTKLTVKVINVGEIHNPCDIHIVLYTQIKDNHKSTKRESRLRIG